jgi:hypothetical protein
MRQSALELQMGCMIPKENCHHENESRVHLAMLSCKGKNHSKLNSAYQYSGGVQVKHPLESTSGCF